jgi:hypothetical protein
MIVVPKKPHEDFTLYLHVTIVIVLFLIDEMVDTIKVELDNIHT